MHTQPQVLAYVTCSLLWVPNAVLILLLVFSLSSPVTDKAWDCTSPDTDAACMALLHNTPDAAAVAAGFCELSPTQWRWTDPGVKLTSRFNLVCGDAWRAQVANSLFFVGYFIGSGVFGILSDRIGRKPSAFGASLLAAVFAAGASAAPTYYALLALRLLTGV
jgi:MFS family permease